MPRTKKPTTKTIILEVETTATARDLKKREQWEPVLEALGYPDAKVRQVSVQVSDQTKN